MNTLITDLKHDITQMIFDLNSNEDKIINIMNNTKTQFIENITKEEKKEEKSSKDNVLELNKKIKNLENELLEMKNFYEKKVDQKQDMLQKEIGKIHLKYQKLIQNIMSNADNTISDTEKQQNIMIKNLERKIKELKNKIYSSKTIEEKKRYQEDFNNSQKKFNEFQNIINTFKEEKTNKINEQIQLYLKNFKNNIDEYIKGQFSNHVNEFLKSFLNSKNEIIILNIKNQIVKITDLKKDKLSQPINHLNIIISWKKELQKEKTSLINKILKENENKELNDFETIFKEYFSKKIPYITLIEPIGIDSKNFKFSKFEENTKKLIKKRMINKKQDSFIHSIIYLFTSNRLEESIINSINELNNEIPVIFIYTKVKDIKVVENIQKRLKEKDFNGDFICLNEEINDENINKIIEISKKGIQKSCIKFMIEILRKNINSIFEIKDKKINVDEEIKNVGLNNINTNEIYKEDITQSLNNLLSKIFISYTLGNENNPELYINNNFTEPFLKKSKIKFEEIFIQLFEKKLEDLTYELIIIQQEFIKKNREYSKYIQKKSELRKECEKQLFFNFLPFLINIGVKNLFTFFLKEFIEKLKIKIKEIFEQNIKDKNILDYFENNIKAYFKTS